MTRRYLLMIAILSPLLGQAEAFTLVFAGGAGGVERASTLTHLEARLRSLDPKRSVVVFTGNYSAGELPEEGAPGRSEAERDVLAHTNATRAFVQRGGKVYFLAGSRDFAAGGTKAARRLARFLNRAVDADFDVMPQAGCGDPVLLDLTPGLGLLLLNSPWWMQDWEADPHANQGCKVKTREGLRPWLRDAFNDYRTRRIVVATHHPLHSYAALGELASPLDALALAAGVDPRSPHHPTVRAWAGLLEDEADRYGELLFVSGHDPSLQYLKPGRQAQLIAGTTGETPGATARAGLPDFAAAAAGWVELRLEPAGGGTATLVSGKEGATLFEVAVDPVPSFAPRSPPPPMPRGPVRVAFAKTPSQRRGAITRFFIGGFYSDAYTLELPYEVLDLKTAQGGLTPFKTGGSLQTSAISLRDSQGAVWSMRATRKDSSRFLGNKQVDGTGTVSHALTASHPEAALSVAVLAKAVGVLHAEPRLMYLPDQEALGAFRGYLADELVLLERSPKEPEHGVLPQTLAGKPSPFGPTRFRTTAQTMAKLVENPAAHQVDQEAMLRARLLDVFIGDWDRHQNQWRFAASPNEDGTVTYRPIPRDRDQAFAHYDGAALVLARITASEPREIHPFTGDYGSLQWLIYGGRHLDPILLNRLSRARWLEIAAQMQRALTDATIDEAMATWHRETYALDGARIAAALKARRDKLVDAAGVFFALINEKAEVLGSRKADHFDLWFQSSGAVRVTVRSQGAPWFDRSYHPRDTAELHLYGLEGDDVLEVHGVPHSAIDIRFSGGEGVDTVTALTPVVARAIRLYDDHEGAVIDPSIEIRDERSDRARLNQYDPTENHEPNIGVFIPGLRANPDEGVLLGGRYTHVVHGFKKSPYAGRHDLAVTVATATLGVAVDYRAVVPQSADLLDQQLDVSLKSPTYTRNFFGITNRVLDEGEPLDAGRVRQPAAEARYGLFYGFSGERSRVGAQVVIQTLAINGQSARLFGGGRLSGTTSTFDDPALPTRGIGVSASLENRFDLLTGTQFSTNYKVAGAAAIPFGREQRFVLLTRASVEGIVGEHEWYFSPTLGDSELRALHSHQLAGDVAFAQTTDLRITVIRSQSIMPGKVGVNLSVDHGRVFGPQITDDTWHLSLGGGAWWSVMDAFILSAGIYRGLQGGSRFSLVLGPLFLPPAI